MLTMIKSSMRHAKVVALSGLAATGKSGGRVGVEAGPPYRLVADPPLAQAALELVYAEALGVQDEALFAGLFGFA